VPEASHRSIGEVLGLLKQDHPDITISKIRFLESQGLISPERTPSGYRKFYDTDIERLRWILEQQRDHFLPLKVIKRRLDSGNPVSVGETSPTASREPTLFAQKLESTDGESADARDQGSGSPPDHGSPGDAAESEPSRSRAPLATSSGSVSLTARELADAVGVDTMFIDEIHRMGLLEPIIVDGADVYDHEALLVAKACATFKRLGFDQRHLRMFKVAAERQAGVFEQLFGARARHSVESATQARAELDELVALGEAIQRSIMYRNLGSRLRHR